VTDNRDYALLFSREPVPRRGSSANGGVARSAYDPDVAYKVRVGIQACGTDFLETYASLPGCDGDKENATRKKGGKDPARMASPVVESKGRWHAGAVVQEPPAPRVKLFQFSALERHKQ